VETLAVRCFCAALSEIRRFSTATLRSERRFRLINSPIATQHAMEMFCRSLTKAHARSRLDRLANRLTKILAKIRKLKIN